MKQISLLLGCVCLMAACAPYAEDDYRAYPHGRVYYRDYYRRPYHYGYAPRYYYYRSSPYYRERVYGPSYYGRPYYYWQGGY